MKRILVVLLLLGVFAALPTNVSAQFTNHTDFLQLGVITDRDREDLNPFSGLVIGYHFTTVEVGRLNTLGLGAAVTLTSENDPPDKKMIWGSQILP